MDHADSGATSEESGGEDPLAEPRRAYVETKSKGTPARPGRYAQNADSVLTEFTGWITVEYGVTELEDIETRHMRAYVRELKSKWRRDEFAASTCRTYFRTVRAWLAWCVKNGWIATNPAENDAAAEDLPRDSTKENDSRQVWSDQSRHDLLMWVRGRTESAYESPMCPPELRLRRTRDRALVTVLARTGVRGAEVFRDPGNSRRDGLTWERVDLAEGTIEVWGKSQDWEYVPFPESAHAPLRQWKRELRPTSEDWPVFPSLSGNSLSAAIRKSRNGTVPDHQVDRAVERQGYLLGYLDLAREHDCAPSAMSTTAARNTMQRLCEAAGVEEDGEYLKPHGGRRKLGDELYRENPALAQKALRHADITVTQESYSYIDQGEVGDEIDRIQADDES
ncbi:tyrosine-type recombinase/integrase [Haloarchaeobius amylolyticus]|uniref:tyrosine-type recombinase/integrase n=1 Tax=Haloarchaeobius amylolyticus TaxID=1198296 RepID=UPI00226EF4D2|nr:tyrosine-type recombinase/integrase [Haloarchaeobius amylolyticus]